MEPRVAEHLRCDPVVAARRVEHALVVAPADVDAERHPLVAVDDGVVELDAGIEQPIGIASALPVALADCLVEERGVLRGIDLHVLAAQASQLGDLAPREVHEVRQIGVARGIGAAGLLGIVVGRRLLGADERDLDRLVRPASKIGELLYAHLPPPPQPIDDDRTLEGRFSPLSVAKRDRPAGVPVESVEGLDQVAVKGVATHLSVGDDVEPGRFLQRDRLVDGPILEAFEIGSGELPSLDPGAGVEEVRGPQQAADDVASGVHHVCGCPERALRARESQGLRIVSEGW